MSSENEFGKCARDPKYYTTDELFKPCERLNLPAVIRNTATDRNRPIVYDDPGN